MKNQPAFDQDEDVQLLNPDPETAALDDESDDFDGGAEFDGVGSGATSGYGEDDLTDIEDEFGDDDNLVGDDDRDDEDGLDENDPDDDSME